MYPDPNTKFGPLFFRNCLLSCQEFCFARWLSETESNTFDSFKSFNISFSSLTLFCFSALFERRTAQDKTRAGERDSACVLRNLFPALHHSRRKRDLENIFVKYHVLGPASLFWREPLPSHTHTLNSSLENFQYLANLDVAGLVLKKFQLKVREVWILNSVEKGQEEKQKGIGQILNNRLPNFFAITVNVSIF